MGVITENVKKILHEIPDQVQVVAAAKTRTFEEIQEVIDAGITIIGENYLQDARRVMPEVDARAQWHFIGHIQKNKVRQVVPLFDMIETVDSIGLAQMIEKQAHDHGKCMPVLIEVNSAREAQKSGVMPQDVPSLIRQIGTLEHLRVQGLMTMGPFLDDPQGLRPYFHATRSLFDELKKTAIPGVEMLHLSMGMSESYRIAIEEGATMIRIGTLIFGPRL